MKIKNLLLSAVAATIALSSCQKNELQKTSEPIPIAVDDPIPDVKLENGYLAFKDLNTFITTLNKVDKMNKSTFDEWERSLGFSSQAGILRKANDELIRVQATSSEASVVGKYKHVLYVDHTGLFGLRNRQEGISTLLNEKGFVKIGKGLVRYMEGLVLSTGTDYASLLGTDHVATLVNNPNVKSFIKPATNNQGLPLNTSLRVDISDMSSYNNTTTVYMFSDIFQNGNKKLFVDLKQDWTTFPQYDGGGNFLYTLVRWRLYLKFGHQKKNGLGVWVSDQSSVYIRNFNLSLDGRKYPVNSSSVVAGGSTYPNSPFSTYTLNLPGQFDLAYGGDQYYYIFDSFGNGPPPGFSYPGNQSYDVNTLPYIQSLWGIQSQWGCVVSEIEVNSFNIEACGNGYSAWYSRSYSNDVDYVP